MGVIVSTSVQLVLCPSTIFQSLPSMFHLFVLKFIFQRLHLVLIASLLSCTVFLSTLYNILLRLLVCRRNMAVVLIFTPSFIISSFFTPIDSFSLVLVILRWCSLVTFFEALLLFSPALLLHLFCVLDVVLYLLEVLLEILEL